MSIADRLRQCKLSIHHADDQLRVIKPAVSVKSTSLTTPFLAKYNKGLFTNEFIHQDIALDLEATRSHLWVNDPMVDLTQILAATNNVQMYVALNHLKENYYQPEICESKINLTHITDVSASALRNYYQATRDIEPGEELLRMYSLDNWLHLILDEIITSHTMHAYFKFLSEFQSDEYCKEETTEKIKLIRGELVLLLDLKMNEPFPTLVVTDQLLSNQPVRTSLEMYKTHPILGPLYFKPKK